jgi:hypothetical protein
MRWFVIKKNKKQKQKGEKEFQKKKKKKLGSTNVQGQKIYFEKEIVLIGGRVKKGN